MLPLKDDPSTMKIPDKEIARNAGFSEDEILLLAQTVFLHPNNSFYKFLKKAGKRSNVFDTQFGNIQEYLALQDDFKSQISDKPEAAGLAGKAICFSCEPDEYGNNIYYFVDSSQASDPAVFYFSKGRRPINNFFKDDRDEEIGLIKLNPTFKEYLSYKTKQKLGKNWWQKLRDYIWTVLTVPIWLPILAYFKIRKNFD